MSIGQKYVQKNLGLNTTNGYKLLLCPSHSSSPPLFCREWKKRRLSKVHQHWGGMEFLNSVLPKTRAPSSYTRLWHIPSCSQTTNCTRFLTLTDHFAPLSRKNYADFLCSKLSSHSPLGHFFFFNYWKLFRIPTCELFESKLLDSFFWPKAGATRHPSYSTSTPLEKNSVLWIVGCLLWSIRRNKSSSGNADLLLLPYLNSFGQLRVVRCWP